ncbi:MAG: type II toxin-antitoxin system VapC family toxin [Candidatus Thorarchaeota archaeon]
MLLDTSFIIDLLRGEKPAIDKIKELEAASIATNISAPSVFELFVGVALTTKPQSEKRRITEILDSWATMPLDTESAGLGGRIHGQLIREGQMIDPEDSMTAGIALHNNETLLTKNLSHFQRIPDLDVEEY